MGTVVNGTLVGGVAGPAGPTGATGPAGSSSVRDYIEVAAEQDLSSTTFVGLATPVRKTIVLVGPTLIVRFAAMARRPSGSGGHIYAAVKLTTGNAYTPTDITSTATAEGKCVGIEMGGNAYRPISGVLKFTGLAALSTVVELVFQVDGAFALKVLNARMEIENP